jgi:hypothetical protein
MKLFKFILVLILSLAITRCSDSSEERIFVLSNTAIAGTYNINSLTLNTKVTSVTEVAGVLVPFTVATSTSNGDTFQVDFVLNENASYTASGQYRIVSTVTPAVGNPVNNSEIIDFSDAGTYQLNTFANTITFTPSGSDNFIEGTLNIEVFNESTLSLSQELEEVDNAITTEIKANIRFIRQ